MGPARLLAPGPPRYATRGNQSDGEGGKTPCLECVMRDSDPMNSERTVQPKFRMLDLAAGLMLLAATTLFHRWLLTFPNRHELGWRVVRIELRPIQLDSRALAPLRLAGAWQLSSDDPRFGGISALAIDRGRMVGLSDSGVVIRFSAPGQPSGPARIGELPDGPGSGRFKRNRDSEALLRDPGGRGWWVAFENRDELWLYDRDFGRALERIQLGDHGWPANRGVEGAAADGQSLLLFPEGGDSLLHVTGTHARELPIAHARGWISDAAAVGPEQFIAIERRLIPLGFRNSLVMVERTRAGYRFGRRLALSLSPIDNVEAIAIESLPGGKGRLWLMTDDNFQPPLRTLLIALDLWAPPTPARGI